MNLIYLSLGSNLGRREQHLEDALELIQSRIGTIEKVSRYYESESWGYSSKNSFYNCCVSLRTNMLPLVLLDQLLEIEKALGRIRENTKGRRGERAYSDRIIDIDLLLYGDYQMEHPRLVIPHPSMGDRRFVLAPLAEIAPDLIHPLAGMSINSMLQECADQVKVAPIGEN
mgnify:FL=1